MKFIALEFCCGLTVEMPVSEEKTDFHLNQEIENELCCAKYGKLCPIYKFCTIQIAEQSFSTEFVCIYRK